MVTFRLYLLYQLYQRPIFYWANISRIMFENYILWETETSYYPTAKCFLFDAKIITSEIEYGSLEWVNECSPAMTGLLSTVTDVSKTCEG